MKYTSNMFGDDAPIGTVELSDCLAAWEQALPQLSGDLKPLVARLKSAHLGFIDALALADVVALPDASQGWLQASAFRALKSATEALLGHVEGTLPAFELVWLLFNATASLESSTHQMTYYVRDLSRSLAEQRDRALNRVAPSKLN